MIVRRSAFAVLCSTFSLNSTFEAHVSVAGLTARADANDDVGGARSQVRDLFDVQHLGAAEFANETVRTAVDAIMANRCQ
jgi:hypothetical protein